MPGLLNQQPQPDEPDEPDAEAPAPDEAEGDESQQAQPPAPAAASGGRTPNASAAQQVEYNQLIANALKLIYSQQALPGIVQSLKGGGDAVLGLANTTAMVVIRLMDSARQAGQQLDTAVLVQGGREILQDLADLSAHMNMHSFTQDELDRAAIKAMDLARMFLAKAGRLDPTHAQSDLSRLKALQQNGQLDQIAPGFTKMFDQRQVQSGLQRRGVSRSKPPAGNGGLVQAAVAPPGRGMLRAQPAPSAAQPRPGGSPASRGKPSPGAKGY